MALIILLESHHPDNLAQQFADILNTLSFRCTLRAEESLFSSVLSEERFLASPACRQAGSE
jgi:hypothetical protein